MQENKTYSPLEVTNGKALLELEVAPTKYIIADLLPVGLHLLAGSPKIGKSWFALWLCNQVASGEKVWQFETLGCPTLYLSLEDTLDRLHLRLSSITEAGCEDAYFATKADSLDGLLTAQLEGFIKTHPDVGLIVIDTFARVRESSEQVSYAGDYGEMGKFKEIADKHRLAIVLVHHLRKTKDSDPINMVSGSTGLIGAVDGIYILEKGNRQESKARLHITGRDMPDMQLQLDFDRETSVWSFEGFLSGETESLDEKLLVTIEKLIEQEGFTGTATELVAAMQEVDGSISIKPNQLTRLLRSKGLVLQKRGIVFSTKRTNTSRMLTLQKEKGLPDSTAAVRVCEMESPQSNQERDCVQLQAGDGDDDFTPPTE